MEEIIRILKLGYFEAIKDASKSNNTKKYEIIVSDEVKSKLYDIGYIMGYNDYFKYYKNNY